MKKLLVGFAFALAFVVAPHTASASLLSDFIDFLRPPQVTTLPVNPVATTTNPGTTATTTPRIDTSTITVTNPLGGQTYTTGNSMDVLWKGVTASTSKNVAVVLRKVNTGANFPVDSGSQAQLVPNTGMISHWPIGNIEAGTYILRVLCVPTSLCTYGDSAAFTIIKPSSTTTPATSTPPLASSTISVVFPNGGQVIPRDTAMNIYWTQGMTAPVAITFTGSDTKSYQFGKTSGATGKNTLVINASEMNIPNAKYKLTICTLDGENRICDSSDSYFTVASSTVTNPPTPLSTPVSGQPFIKNVVTKASGDFEVIACSDANQISGTRLAGTSKTNIRVFIASSITPVVSATDETLYVKIPCEFSVGKIYDLYVANSNGISNVVKVKVVGTREVPTATTTKSAADTVIKQPVTAPGAAAPFVALCYATPSTAQTGQTVLWRVTKSGGSEPYTYSWSSNDGITGSYDNIGKIYSTAGYKTASVTVKSGAQSFTADCNVNVVAAPVITSTPTPSTSSTPSSSTTPSPSSTPSTSASPSVTSSPSSTPSSSPSSSPKASTSASPSTSSSSSSSPKASSSPSAFADHNFVAAVFYSIGDMLDLVF